MISTKFKIVTTGREEVDGGNREEHKYESCTIVLELDHGLKGTNYIIK